MQYEEEAAEEEKRLKQKKNSRRRCLARIMVREKFIGSGIIKKKPNENLNVKSESGFSVVFASLCRCCANELN